jgi:hypothetical protein
MSTSDRLPWETATVLDQDLLDNCADNLTNSLELIAEIELSSGTIYASDRNKYVGSRFYEAICKFPAIDRTIGDWLATEVEFSTLTLELSNVDGRFNSILPSGIDFDGWVGKTVTVKLGLRNIESTYKIIFKGLITDIGGFRRNLQTITVIARDDYDRLTMNIPNVLFNFDGFPAIENDKEGTFIPFIIGDWNTVFNSAAIPGIQINCNDPNVFGGSYNNIQILISINQLTALDINNIYLKRSSDMFLIDPGDINNVGPYFNYFEIYQNNITRINGEPYLYQSGDEFYCRVIGPSLSGYPENIVEQAKHLLKEFGGLVDADFDISWVTYRDKITPSVSAIANIKSRAHIRETQVLITYVRSMLQQVRLELFINSERKLELKSLHYDEFNDTPSLAIKNWDIEQNSFKITLDDRNNVNRLNAVFNYEPVVKENASTTVFFRNDACITQLGKTISKQLIFPNLYVASDVENQVIETLKLTSSFFEIITLNATWRMLLVELGDFVKIDVAIGATIFQDVPCLVRQVGYDPEGFKIKLSIWSMQMFPFLTWNPGYSGIISGANATITRE